MRRNFKSNRFAADKQLNDNQSHMGWKCNFDEFHFVVKLTAVQNDKMLRF